MNTLYQFDKKYDLISKEQRLYFDQLRKQGLPRPPNISYGDWIGPLELKPKHQRIALMIVSGKSQRHVAKTLAITESRLSILLSASNMRMLIRELCLKRDESYRSARSKIFANR